MAFTNNRNVFYNNKSFDEKLFANGLGMGTPSFVCKGLELTGTTLTSGVFNNTGAYGILGLEGETHTIPANYTGFIVIKTTMNSQNGFNEIITSATKLDTDQRDISNIKHFTIYELDAGVIVQDFRHINYVKSFYLKNMGGSNIAWVLNGFTSETFDASVLAGNRTLLNNVDIAYDDTIHAATSYDNILLDLLTKSQTNVGNDKPFILNFVVKKDIIMTNLANGTINYINTKYGYTIDPLKEINFKMEVATSLGDVTGEIQDFANKVTIWGDDFNFVFDFDYDDFAFIKVRDSNMYYKAKTDIDVIIDTREGDSQCVLALETPINDYTIEISGYCNTLSTATPNTLAPLYIYLYPDNGMSTSILTNSIITDIRKDTTIVDSKKPDAAEIRPCIFTGSTAGSHYFAFTGTITKGANKNLSFTFNGGTSKTDAPNYTTVSTSAGHNPAPTPAIKNIKFVIADQLVWEYVNLKVSIKDANGQLVRGITTTTTLLNISDNMQDTNEVITND